MLSINKFCRWKHLNVFAKALPELQLVTEKNLLNLIGALEPQLENIVNWFKENKMIVNANKFQALIIDKRSRDHEDGKIY